MTIRVAIASGTALGRADLARVIEAEPHLRHVASAGSVEALRSAAAIDVVVCHAPGPETIEATLNALDAGVAVLVLANEVAAIEPLLRAGAGWLPLDASAREIAAAIGATAAGLIALRADRFARLLDTREQRAAMRASTLIEPLTARELEVLRLLAEGLGNKALARRLAISTHTAKHHVGRILAKLDSSSRAEAVAKAMRDRLICA